MSKFYDLEDVNQFFHNCGHYPEWVVVERDGEMPDPVPTTRRGTPLMYLSEDEARAVAARLNAASKARWREFLDG